MVRPQRLRHVSFQPGVTYFKPAGVPLKNLEEINLSFDELEAIRLIDLENRNQIEAGEKMKISQSTLSRLLKSARGKLADATTKGKAIKIHGGNFKIVKPQNNLIKHNNH